MDEPVPRLIEVYRAANVMHAHAVKAALENAGIQAYVDGDLLPNLTGLMPGAWDTLPRVRVAETQAIEARQLIEHLDQLDAAQRSDSDDGGEDDVVRCLACGEVMGEDDDACPACGWSYEEEA